MIEDAETVPPAESGVSLSDFHALMPMHSYIFAPTREMWPASSVNARVPPQPLVDRQGMPKLNKKGEPVVLSAAAWLDRFRPVEQMTWAPGFPMLIRDRLISEGGWIQRPDVTCFNLYRPPAIRHGRASEATMWLDHIERVYGARDGRHIVDWLAHRVQRPCEKINHAIVLGGSQGIGKDTLLEPVKQAIGPWNFHEVSPQHLLGRFNGFAKSVILRTSEARDLGEVNRFAFYDHMKTYTAAPPDVLRVDEKHIREYAVLNVCGVIITTNHKADGIYLPADDRRHFVAWSEKTKEDFTPDYWNGLWGWYERGGFGHVAAYLAGLDISSFNAKAPPPKTPAWHDIVAANSSPEDAELADTLDKMGRPAATTVSAIALEADHGFAEWLRDRKNSRRLSHRMEAVGYVAVRNEGPRDGLWVVRGKRQNIYAKSELSIRERHVAAQKYYEENR